MSANIDLFYNTYANFTEQVLASVREATFGEDIGQNSWVTVDEYKRFIGWLLLSPASHVLGERYEGVQKFLAAVHRLTHERRLSRIADLVER